MAGTDSEVSVSLVARVDQLEGGLNEAVDALRESVEKMTEGLGELKESAKESAEGTESTLKGMAENLKTILHIDEFNFLKESATEALEMVKGAFESTIGKAEEFGLQNAKFAAMMGTTEEQAAGLSAALRGVGSSAEDFSSLALRMEMRLAQNEDAFKQLGITTRDANGQLLGGKDLIDSAIKTMETYKTGTDQNAFALQVFGRRAADVYDLMRVGSEQVQHQIDIYNEMGVQLSGTAKDSEKLEEGLNDLETMVDALGIKIGQELMPNAQNALEWMGTEGVGFAKELALAIVELGKSVSLFVEGVVHDIGKLAAPFEKVSQLIDRVSQINEEMDKASDPSMALAGGATVGKRLSDSWEHFANAMKMTVTPLDETTNGIDQSGKAAEQATDAVGHLSAAWDRLLEGFGKVGERKESIAESLGAIQGGAEAAADPLLQALKKHENPYLKEGGARSFKTPKTGGGNQNAAAEEQIASDQKLAEMRIALDRQTNEHMLAESKETVDQYISVQKQAEDEDFNIKLDGLQKQLQLPNQSKAAQQKINDEIAQLTEQHINEMVKITADGEDKKAAAAKGKVRDFIQADDDRLKSSIAADNEMVRTGKMTATERYQAIVQMAQQVKAEELSQFDAVHQGLTEGTEAYNQAMHEREAIVKKSTSTIGAAHKQLSTQIEADVKKWVQPMEQQFSSAINSMIFEGKSFETTMTNAFKGMFESLIQQGEQWVVQQAEQLVANQILGKTSALANATTQITAEAAIASAAAFADSATLGPVGLAAAPGAASGAYAAVMAMTGLASAAGGMVLDRDQLVYAHQKEMILPANLSQGVQNLISNGGNTSRGGDFNATYAPTIHNNQKELPQMLQEHSRAFFAFLAQGKRDGKLGFLDT